MIDMLVSQVLDLMTPVLLAAMAGALCERAGVFNIALTSTYTMTIGLRAGGTFNVQATT